jgi:hypothetical protein
MNISAKFGSNLFCGLGCFNMARWAKKGNNSKMGNQIYFKIARYVDLAVLIIFTPSDIWYY